MLDSHADDRGLEERAGMRKRAGESEGGGGGWKERERVSRLSPSLYTSGANAIVSVYGCRDGVVVGQTSFLSHRSGQLE